MIGTHILQARLDRGWEQMEAAAKLEISQSYLSLIETGKRRATEKLARRAVKVFNLSPALLPVASRTTLGKRISSTSKNDYLAAQLAALGYPGFSQLKNRRKINPAEILLSALEVDDLDSRLVEALPWVIYNYLEMDWDLIIKTAKIIDAQNRLGFLVDLACEHTAKIGEADKEKFFKKILSKLEKSRLLLNDSFRRRSLTEAEKKWLVKNRPRNARYWRVLSNLGTEHLVF